LGAIKPNSPVTRDIISKI